MATPGPSTGDTKSPILSKFMRRASRVLKTRSIGSASEIGTPSPTVESKTVPTARVSTKAAAAAAAAASDVRAPDAPAAAAVPATTSTDRTFTNSAQYLKKREEKARVLFEKYGMNLSPEEWTSPSTGKTEWVEKKVVMRVHRQCHRCQTTFGRERSCNQCQHTRCKKCPRYPLKMSAEKTGIAVYDIDYSVLVDPLHDVLGVVKPRALTIQTKSGRDAIRKHPTQRVRRTCHRCDKLFVGKATTCEGCKHQRCPKCPRDPPKENKWPNGYPGDVQEQFPLAERVRKPIRTRYRWECHTCQKTFIEHEKLCRGCGHERCNDCTRQPPKKIKKEHPEDVVKSLEEKINRMALGSASQAGIISS